MAEADGLSGPPTLAVVVPVLGDTAAFRTLLARLLADAPAPDRIVVVSGRPDAELEAVCRQAGCEYRQTAANRGAQLDLGARAADADVLWFLHADAEPPPGAIAAIRAAIAGGAAGGCFRFAFQGARTWYKSLLERLIALRIRCGGVPYGDQGLFVRRDRYRACGGFAKQPLFEEVGLVRRLRRHGRFVVLDAPLRVSTRRWERDGWLARTLHNRWLALLYALGVPAERLARAYRGLVRSNGEADR